MRRFVSVAVAAVLAATVMAGCRDKNVSDREDGMITEPTVTTESMFTMPSTDTAPIDTVAPSTESSTDMTGGLTDPTAESGAAESTAPEGKVRRARPNIMN